VSDDPPADATLTAGVAGVERAGVTVGSLDLEDLTRTFAAPKWLKDLGRTSWLLVGTLALLAGIVFLLATTETIVGPLLVATIVATVAMPVAGWLAGHMPRAAAAALVLVGIVAISVLVVVTVIAGITSQDSQIGERASAAADKAEHWLERAGVNHSGSSTAASSVKADVPDIISTLTKGIVSGIGGLASVAFGLSLGALSLFFLLKDGPVLRAWLDRHLGVPVSVGRVITGGLVRSLRGYFRGVTLVAAFNGVIVGLGALVLGVPLAGTIAVVTFVTAYVPFIGAFVAGAFAVVIALGAKGTTTALIMLVIVILANGLLQNLVQPFAMGSALHLHPLAVLVVTIGAGCIFGTFGLILAAPLLSAALHIHADLGRARLGQAPESDAAGALPAAAAQTPAAN
jgi:putative heme transporter